MIETSWFCKGRDIIRNEARLGDVGNIYCKQVGEVLLKIIEHDLNECHNMWAVSNIVLTPCETDLKWS